MYGSKGENGSESREEYEPSECMFSCAGVEKMNCSRAAILAVQLGKSTLRLTISFCRGSVRINSECYSTRI